MCGRGVCDARTTPAIIRCTPCVQCVWSRPPVENSDGGECLCNASTLQASHQLDAGRRRGEEKREPVQRATPSARGLLRPLPRQSPTVDA